jgi:hypothetical protein
MSTAENARIATLPKWAQRIISDLRFVRALREEVIPSRWVGCPGNPDNCQITSKDGTRRIKFILNPDDTISVRGDDTISVRPEATNALTIGW